MVILHDGPNSIKSNNSQIMPGLYQITYSPWINNDTDEKLDLFMLIRRRGSRACVLHAEQLRITEWTRL